MKKLAIDFEQSNQRLDKFLAKEFLNMSRGTLIREIKNRNVSVNGKAQKPSYILKENDVVEINFSQPKKELQPNLNIRLDIIHEDENIIVVNKPARISVHPVSFGQTDTLVNALIHKFPEIINVGDKSKDSDLRPGIVHRLDKETSGVMVIARNQKSFDELKNLFKERKILKHYLALVHGIPKEPAGTIEKPLAKSSDYKKQVIAHRKTKTAVRPAATEYKIFKTYDGYSLLEVFPKTGRTHQIRVHLASIGHPIVGDRLYKIRNQKIISAPRQLLHARSIKFELFGKHHCFEASIPDDLKRFID